MMRAGRRFRSWIDVGLAVRRSPIADFSRSFNGPPLLPDTIAEYEQHGGPLARHRWLESRGLFPASSPTKHEHKVLSTIMQLAGEVDQVDPTQLLCFELVERRKTLIETVLGNAKSAGCKADWGASDHWIGCPMIKDDYALTSNPFRAYVAGELKADAAIAKELRKAKTG